MHVCLIRGSNARGTTAKLRMVEWNAVLSEAFFCSQREPRLENRKTVHFLSINTATTSCLNSSLSSPAGLLHPPAISTLSLCLLLLLRLNLRDPRLRCLLRITSPIHLLEPQLLRLHAFQHPYIDDTGAVEEAWANTTRHARAAAGGAEVVRHRLGCECVALLLD